MNKKTAASLMVVCAIGAATSTFFLVQQTMKAQNKTVLVPIVSTQGTGVSANSKILANDLEYVKVNPNAIQGAMLTNGESIVGNYALQDMKPGEYIYGDWVTPDVEKSLKEKARYGAITLPVDMKLAVNSEIKENDFVQLIIVTGVEKDSAGNAKVYSGDMTTDDLPSNNSQTIMPPQLQAVRVLGVIDNTGLDINDKRDAMKGANGQVSLDATLPQACMLILDCDTVQSTYLLQGMHSGVVHVKILPEETQNYWRDKWGLNEDSDGSSNTSAEAPNPNENSPISQAVQEQATPAPTQMTDGSETYESTPVEQPEN